MDLGLKGKVAVVAGASKGLGFATAQSLGAEGAKLAICSRTADTIQRAAEKLNAQGFDVIGIQADVSVPDQAQAFVSEACTRLGTIDILVTNAGGPPSLTFEQIDTTAWEDGFRLNLLSTITMIRTALPTMKEKYWGRIINMTSIAAKQPVDGLILSNTIRSGVIGLAKSLSRELAPFNITVNNILPGYFYTNRVQNLAEILACKAGSSPDTILSHWENDIPLKRLGNPDEFGDLAAFLASEKAAYITGTSIQIDGGFCRASL